MANHEAYLERAKLSLTGLSIGDVFGDRFFIHAHTAQAMIRNRALPSPPWDYTDDTNMALSIYDILRRYQTIQQDELAASFAQHYDAGRGYGPAMHRLLARIAQGDPWQDIANSLFDGQGSYGNGAAMRVAPLGAYFADDMEQVIVEAKKSAEITHAHPEGIAGAIAVAVAAAYVSRLDTPEDTSTFINAILPYIPDSEVKSRLKRARDIQSKDVNHVIGMIGNGYKISAQDTVPFALWCVGEAMTNYEEALWLTASGLGDVDTNCAIVGGIVALYVGADSIPSEWIQHREPLPSWTFEG